MSALDDARYVRYNEVRVFPPHHSEVRDKSGERVVRDFGARARYARDQGGFARVWISYQPYIRQELQLEFVRFLFAGFPGFAVQRCLSCGCGETGVAASPLSATCYNYTLVRL